MSRNLSDAAKRAIYSQSTEKCFVTLITIDHESFTEPARISDDATVDLPEAGMRGTVSRGNEYIYCPCKIVQPTQDDSGISRARIEVDNVDRRIMDKLRSANSKVSVTLEVVLSDSPDTVEISIEDFRLERVPYDRFVISGEISVEYYDLEPYPAKRFTPSGFAGIF